MIPDRFVELIIGESTEQDIPDDLKDEAQAAREALIEAAADFDDTVIEGGRRLMEDLRKYAIEPGEYYMPYLTDMKERETDEYRKKLEQGPVGFMTVTSPDYAMGKSLAQWFAYCLLVGFFTAYVAGLALEPGAGFTAVFRVVGTVALGGYFLALIQDSIWYQRSWATTARYLLDGFIYALGTAAIFAWLWP